MQEVRREFMGLPSYLEGASSSSAKPTCPGNCLYIYSSAPKPLPIYGRPKFRNNVPYPRGIGDYYDIRWDGRVRRGKAQQPEKSFIQSFNVRKPKTVVRKPRFIYERPPTPPKKSRGNYEGREESHMEELNPDLIEDESAIVYVEGTLDLPTCPSLDAAAPSKDIATEILPGELFDFDNLVVPVCEALVGQVIHRSLLELLEEEELESLRTQQAKFEDTRAQEHKKLLEMKEQHDRLEAERVAVAERAKSYRAANEAASHRLEAVAFSSFYLGHPLNDVKDSLRLDNSLTELQNVILSQFNPWINKQVEKEVAAQTICRNLFDDIILSTVKTRDAEDQLEGWTKAQEEFAKLQFDDLMGSTNRQSMLGEDDDFENRR